LKCSHIPHNPVDSSKPVFTIEEVTVPEVIKIISSFKSSKAKDTFGLTSDFLKTHKEALAGPIAHLVNLSIKYGIELSANKYFTHHFQSSREMGYYKTDRTFK